MGTPLLQVKNLCVDFRSENHTQQAVQDVSFEVHKGETLAIVGESGSGKTVTSLSILQLLRGPHVAPSRGEIIFSPEGSPPVNLVGLPEKSLCAIRGNRIAMIFQEPMTSLNPVQRCGNQVMEAIFLHRRVTRKEAREKTLTLFSQVKLKNPGEVFAKYPHQLSGGQKQRVMIAMAMSCDPALLIADEPTTALDVTVQKSILELLQELQKTYGLSIIYITHDLGLVSGFANRVLVMYRGGVVESGPTEKIFSAPVQPYTRALIACRPSPAMKGKRLPVVSDFMGGTKKEVSAGNTIARVEGTSSTGSAPREILLKVEGLTVQFPIKKSLTGGRKKQFTAVDDVSFEVRNNEILGLVGESGCGKTTLGRTLLRLTEPTSGKILFRGQDVSKLKTADLRRMRKNIQIVFQDPYGSLNPRLTIGDAIEEPMKVHQILPTHTQRKDRIMELLEKVDLKPEHFNRYPHEFSGGQRQRICIARALSIEPSFIVCDESVSALDVSVQAQVLNLIGDLRLALGFTSIFITHDLGVVYYLSDRIMVMHEGKIVETGTAEEIYYHPQNEYTQRLIGAMPKIHLLQGEGK
ncbi:MAG: ABC transporter ATP-binding protein [Bacteroidota bacterium]|nr:ABC transporter ATP-binding protein [Bacteroidota bacterium]